MITHDMSGKLKTKSIIVSIQIQGSKAGTRIEIMFEFFQPEYENFEYSPFLPELSHFIP